MGKILDSIQAISEEAQRALSDPELPRLSLVSGLSVSLTPLAESFVLNAAYNSQSLIEENHSHLVTLGVSHPSLEVIRETTATSPYHLSTKLTGAGGGGCAVTLLPDGM